MSISSRPVPPTMDLDLYSASKSDFESRFQTIDKQLPLVENDPDQIVSVIELEAAAGNPAFFANAPSGDNVHKMMVIYVALEPDNKIRYGIHFVYANADWEYRIPGRPMFLIEDNELEVSDNTQWSLWKNNYFNNAEVKRAEEFEPLTSEDAKCVIFPWTDEVQELINANENEVPNLNDRNIRFSSIALDYSDSDGGMEGYRHSIALVFTQSESGGGYTDLLNNASSSSTYYYRAADFGSLCPPECEKFK